MLPFLKSGYRIALGQDKFDSSCSEVYLFGYAAEYAKCFPGAKLTFISPPALFNFPANTTKVYQKRIEEKVDCCCRIEYY